MRGRSEVKLVGFVEEGGERVGSEQRRGPEDLDSVRAFFGDPLREFARLLGRVDRATIPTPLAREDVWEQPWSDDLIFRTAIALV